MIALTLAAAALSAPHADPVSDWQLVRSRAAAIGPLSWQRIGEVYLAGRDWELVGEDAGNPRPETSRMVVGSPSDHSQVEELAAAVGVGFAEDRLVFEGEPQPTGTGFAAYAPDPDGGGILFLVCGADARGVLASFQTGLGLHLGQFALTRAGRRVRRGSLERRYDLSAPRVVRLDLDLEHLLATAPPSGPERALRVARGFVGYAHVFGALGVGDLLPFAEELLAEGAALDSARARFADRDPGRDVLEAWRASATLLEAEPKNAPVFYVLYGLPRSSNAMNFGHDPVTGRRQVLFNLTALAVGRRYEAALVHESVHTFQDLSGKRLVDRAMAEGVATLVSQLLVEGLGDADALLWTEAELNAAEARRDELVAAFRRDAASTDRALHSGWMDLGTPHADVPGAPSRCAYYVGWLAAKAWLAAAPDREPKGLLRAGADELLSALP